MDDSDDDVKVQKTTKTQKKKEERKISDKAPKVNPNKMAEGGFEVTQTKTGGKAAANPNKHGHHEHERAAYKHEAEGVEHKERRERQPFRGKPREDAHPFDR